MHGTGRGTRISICSGANISFIGQDDKTHILIGIAATNKQAPLLMCARYKVSLPGHDFIVATKHKFSPTVANSKVIWG